MQLSDCSLQSERGSILAAIVFEEGHSRSLENFIADCVAFLNHVRVLQYILEVLLRKAWVPGQGCMVAVQEPDFATYNLDDDYLPRRCFHADDNFHGCILLMSLVKLTFSVREDEYKMCRCKKERPAREGDLV